MPTIDEFIAQLQEHRPPLYPQRVWKPELSRQIEQAPASELTEACRAGLLLWNDDLDNSHHIVQEMDNSTGSFWHAILHRREGDAANSHYWWRRTGNHPAFPMVNARVLEVLKEEEDAEARKFVALLEQAGTWQPMEFVGRCEMARRGHLKGDWLLRVQVAEMEALLHWCRAQSL